MTNANEVAEITAERFGQPAGDRVRAIAAIHALADFYRDHPDFPVPHSVVATSAVEGAERIEGLAAWMEVPAYGSDADGRPLQLDVALTNGYETGLYVLVRVADRSRKDVDL